MADSYFLPPVTKRVPPAERTPEVRSAAYRHFFWYRRGVQVEIPDKSGVFWQGGRWHGPLTAQQIADITAAGYAARIRTVNNLIELPADIDA